MSDSSSNYKVTHLTDSHEVGVKGDEIIAACQCGAGETWPNKGLGRAHAAAWRSRHQNCVTPTTQAATDG